MGSGTFSDLGELGVIRRLTRGLPADRSVMVGVGDDAAVLRRDRQSCWLFASDMLIEGVHFDRRRTPAREIGWKALAVNVSDIAAMGGVPAHAVMSFGAPRSLSLRTAESIYAGVRACARRFGVNVVGGDTVRAPQLVLDVAILGVVERRHLTLRRGARVGDAVCVTGRLGGSLESGRHARFTPRLAQAQWLVRHARPRAMLDVSDGLSRDAWNLARASRVTLELEASAIPRSRGASLAQALHDGEDFELLFTVPASAARRLPARIAGVPVTRIGRVTRKGADVRLRPPRGAVRRLADRAFEHF